MSEPRADYACHKVTRPVGTDGMFPADAWAAASRINLVCWYAG